MGEILRNWIQERLGILIDLTADVFGHHTRDGTLLAQMLHSYDIINRNQVDTIIATQDPALCRVNLKHLRSWLRFVGIECDNEGIEEISCGKGTTSLRLFYKLYLCLETKDRLHFITLQKERERYVPASKKFEVSRVCEEPPPYQSPDHPLAEKLSKGRPVVEWHRSRIPATLRNVQRERQTREPPEKAKSERTANERCKPERKPTTKLDPELLESRELDWFAYKHRVSKKTEPDADADAVPDADADAEAEAEAEVEADADADEVEEMAAGMVVAENPEMARVYVEWLKSRRKRKATVNAVKAEMQKALLSQLWDKLAAKQERAFDEAIARRVLDQSRYEKQMVSKVCEVREQRNAMAENQKIVQDITLEARAVEHRASYDLAKELAGKKQKDVGVECRRMCELRQLLLATKLRKIREKHEAVCRTVLEDLVTLATNIGDHRRINEGRVPPSLLAEWRSLFLRGQPIFVEDIPYGAQRRESSDEASGRRPVKGDACDDWEKVEELRSALLDAYLETSPPWDQSLETATDAERETLQLGRMVHGYVAHRLLDALYARPLNRAQGLLPRSKNVAIVLGIGDPAVFESIRALLDNSDVRAIRMEDAINYCLARYKEEMADVEYIDLNLSAVTANVVQRLWCNGERTSAAAASKPGGGRRSAAAEETSTVSLDTGTKRSSSKSKDRKEKSGDAGTRERETQTPRNIPYDDLDPVLTDSAYMGKWAYEFLALGEPIGNDLATKILIEYLKSLPPANGWALIDYPGTYEQMSLLETTLTGFAPPPDPRAAHLDALTIEDIEDLAPRIVFTDESDPFALSRQSKLVPNPVGARNEAEVSSRSFATLFVRVKQQPKYFERGNEPYEAVAEDAPSIDKHYASRGIARVLYYATFDLPTLKILARLVIGESPERKPSDELFGEALKGFERDTRRGPSAKEAVARRLLTEDELREMRDLEQLYRDWTEDEEEQQDVDVFDDFSMEVESRPAKPGEPTWQWIDLPLPSALLECLGSLWESMERVYVEETKELVFLKSVHASGIGPYADFVARNAREYAERPDTKQNLLRQFHQAFNSVGLDARNDADVKGELHRRVAEFQGQLWQLCDERRRAAEEERRRRVGDDWTAREAVLLFNVYVGLIQAEMDRHVATMRLLQDYYLGMLKKPLPEARISRVALNRAEDAWPETPETPETPKVSAPAEKSVEQAGKTDRARTAKDGSTKTAVAAPAALEIAPLRKEIRDALIDRDRPLESVEATRPFKGVADNARYARSVADAISAAASEQMRREQVSSSTDPELASRGQDFALEWQAAVAYEIERIRLKLDSIVAVARLDVAFLLETLQRAFHGIYDFILDRYWRETKSVNEMANVFCFAIEEGTVLEKEMLLEGDRFVVRSKRKTQVDRRAVPGEVPVSPALRFHVAHLARLMQIFKRVAPQGTLCERALVYILQDLASHGREEGEAMSLPCAWYQLRPRDISALVVSLFDRADYVDWREFLVYALELPMPTVQEILIARDRFRIQDPELRETVTRARYDRTPLWFFECSDACPIARQLLLDEFQRNREELYEEELHLLDGEGPSPTDSATWMSNATGCCREETLRRTLAKDLLCRMYTIDRHAINYTALLLAFCKDEDPAEGFGKALALALGSCVCTSEEDGERYVEELVRRKQHVREERSSEVFHRAALEVAQSIVSHLMHRVEKGRDGGPSTDASSVRIGESGSFKLFDESLAGIDTASGREIEGEERSTDSFWERLAKEHATVVHWVSLDLCLTVLAAALPWYVLQPELAGTRAGLRDRLAPIFQELWDPELDDRKNVVLVHRLLKHDSMRRFLTSLSKFTAKSMGSAVLEILLARENVQEVARG